MLMEHVLNSWILDQLLLKDKAAPTLMGTLAVEWPCCQPDLMDSSRLKLHIFSFFLDFSAGSVP